jgi:hypothetical protein
MTLKDDRDERNFDGENASAGGGTNKNDPAAVPENANGHDENLAAAFQKQVLADSGAGIDNIKNIEYARITGAGKRSPNAFYYYLCAFLLLFIVFMAYNISIVANEKAGMSPSQAYYHNAYEAEPFGETRPAVYDDYRDPAAMLMFFAAEGAVLFILMALFAVLVRFAYLKFSGAHKKISVLC